MISSIKRLFFILSVAFLLQALQGCMYYNETLKDIPKFKKQINQRFALKTDCLVVQHESYTYPEIISVNDNYWIDNFSIKKNNGIYISESSAVDIIYKLEKGTIIKIIDIRLGGTYMAKATDYLVSVEGHKELRNLDASILFSTVSYLDNKISTEFVIPIK